MLFGGSRGLLRERVCSTLLGYFSGGTAIGCREHDTDHRTKQPAGCGKHRGCWWLSADLRWTLQGLGNLLFDLMV